MSEPIDFPEIDEATQKWLDSLPKRKIGAPKKVFTREEDKKILAGYNVLAKEVLAESLGCNKGTVARRYRELLKEIKGDREA